MHLFCPIIPLICLNCKHIATQIFFTVCMLCQPLPTVYTSDLKRQHGWHAMLKTKSCFLVNMWRLFWPEVVLTFVLWMLWPDNTHISINQWAENENLQAVYFRQWEIFISVHWCVWPSTRWNPFPLCLLQHTTATTTLNTQYTWHCVVVPLSPLYAVFHQDPGCWRSRVWVTPCCSIFSGIRTFSFQSQPRAQ